MNIILIAWLTIGEGSPAEPALHVAIIWRREHNHIKYEWLPHTWSGAKSNEWNETRDHLESTIQRLLRSSGALSREAIIKVWFVLLTCWLPSAADMRVVQSMCILLSATNRTNDAWASFWLLSFFWGCYG